MNKKYKPSIKELAFVILIIVFVASNIVLRSLWINSDKNNLSFDNIFSIENVFKTSIELGVFIAIYIIWSIWKSRRKGKAKKP